MFRPIFFVAAILALASCRQQKSETSVVLDSAWVKYARGFHVEKRDGLTHLFVTYPYQGAASGYHYVLVPNGLQAPTAENDAHIIKTPIDNIVCTATTHIPHLDYLGVTDKLIGFPTTDYISSEKMRKRIDAGQVTELGVDKGMDLEKLYSLHPS